MSRKYNKFSYEIRQKTVARVAAASGDCKAVAAELGFCPQTVKYWWMKYKTYGDAGLKDHVPTPRKVAKAPKPVRGQLTLRQLDERLLRLEAKYGVA